jgi:hypothetical protein
VVARGTFALAHAAPSMAASRALSSQAILNASASAQARAERRATVLNRHAPEQVACRTRYAMRMKGVARANRACMREIPYEIRGWWIRAPNGRMVGL